jgi:hypothetical protein
MAVPADTFTTYDSVGIREDLIDVIYDISPTDTPFVSNVGSGSAKGVRHEWQTDELAAVVIDGETLEGDDATAIAITPTDRLFNACQINTKAWIISGTDLVADNAGRGVEMAYQEAKKGLELRRDIEATCVSSEQVGVIPANNATARTAGGVISSISTHHLVGATTGVAPANPGTGTWAARTAGDSRTYDEALLGSLLDLLYLDGANPDTIMLNTSLKREMNGFNGTATSKDIMTPDKRIINAVDFYESDYGVMAIVPNRYMLQTDVFVLDTDMWEVSYHRPFMTYDLAKTGDNEKKQMVVEWTLTFKEEKANGCIADAAPAPAA